MAPEQHRGGPVDHRADIYALGATVYHALAGRPPFEGKTVWDVMVRKLENTPPPLPACGPEGTRLVAGMMAADPDKRISSYDELFNRIDRLSLFGRPSPATRSARRRWWPSAVGGAVVLGASGVAVFGLRGSPAVTQPGDDPLSFVAVGEPESLFDGASLDRWAASGAWAIVPDDEGTPVFIGSGLIRRAFAPARDYQLTLGLDVHEAAAAEVHFAVNPNGRRLVLRVTRDEGAVLGTKDADRGPVRPLFGPVPFPARNWFKDRRPYLEVRVERAGGGWSAWFRGELVGRVFDNSPTSPEFRLAAHDGQVRVDTVLLVPLGPLPTSEASP
jgi:hypothetical protein